MTTVALKKIRDYRWELWFFFGLPVTSWLLALALSLVLIDTYERLWQFWQDLSGIVALAGILAVSYPRVRRLRRPLLKLLWQYSFVGLAISMIVSLIQAILLYPEDLAPFQIGFRGALPVFLSIPISVAALVWFARKASRGGFRYALVFLGLIAHPELTPFSLWAAEGRLVIESVGFYFGGVILSAMLTLVAVWVLHRADSGRVVTGRAIAALFSVGLLGYAAFYFVQSLTYWNVAEWSVATEATAYVTAGVVLHYVVAGGLAYLVRVREIEPYFDPEDDPPPDQGPEPPTDEGDNEFVGLYTRRV